MQTSSLTSTMHGYMIAFYGLYAYIGAHFKSALNTSTSFAGLVTLAYGVGFGVNAKLCSYRMCR